MEPKHDFLYLYLPYDLSEEELDNILTKVPIDLTSDRKDEIQSSLSACFTRYLNERAWQKEPTPSTAVKHFDDIARTADKLVRLLADQKAPLDYYLNIRLNAYLKFRLTDEADSYGEEIGGYPDRRPVTGPVDDSNPDYGTYTDYQGSEQFRGAVQGIVLMREWARRATKLDEPNVGAEKGNVGDRPLQNLLDGLGGLWTDISGKPPTFSTPYPLAGRQPHGRFMRFVQACLKTLLSSVNDPHNANGLDLTADAIKARYDRAKKQKKHGGKFLVQSSQGQK